MAKRAFQILSAALQLYFYMDLLPSMNAQPLVFQMQCGSISFYSLCFVNSFMAAFCLFVCFIIGDFIWTFFY